jgi:hypothetical protein
MDERDDDDEKRRSIRRQRDTSISAFEELRRSGKLSRLRWLIYEYLWNVGPATARECCKALGLETNQAGRFTELRKLDLIYEVGTLRCAVTGRNVIGWDVTDERAPKRTQTLLPEMPRAELVETVLREAVRDLRLTGDIVCAAMARRIDNRLKGLPK